MEMILLEILRERHLRSMRDDGFCTYACFFPLDRGERIDTKCIWGKVLHNMHTTGYQSQHMLKFPHCKNSEVNILEEITEY